MYVEWRWEWTFEILPQMLWATLNTFLAAGVGYAIAAVVGIILMLGQRTPYKISKYCNKRNRRIYSFHTSSCPIIFCLFCCSTIWNNSFSLGFCNDYNWASLRNLSF